MTSILAVAAGPLLDRRGRLANFTSAIGALTVFLVLAAYLYAASIIFLVGIQVDEVVRKDASPNETGILDLFRRGIGRA